MERRSSGRPLHRRILDAIRAEIASCKPGEKLESQNELAMRFKASALTVREALSALAEEGLIERRRGSGTYVSDWRNRQHIGVLIEMDIAHPRTSYFYRRVTQQLRVILRERGYREQLYAGHHPPDDPWNGELTCREFLEDLNRGLLRGLAVVGTDARGAWFDEVRRRGLPVVGAGAGYEYRVTIDMRRLMLAGLDYLLAHGRRRLAYMAWGKAGDFSAALKERGVEARSGWIRHDLHPSAQGAGWEELREIWAACPDKPDGLLISDDILFSDARAAISDLGVRVPDELMVVSHANRGICFPASFPVTRIEVDPDVCAQAICATLIDLVEGRTPASKVIETPFWIVPPSGATLPAVEEPAATPGQTCKED